MKIVFHKEFERQFKRLPEKIKIRVKERNILFEKDPHNLLLNNHALKGKYAGYRSINVTGDIRIVYKLLSDNVALFVAVGPHSKLY